MVYGKVTKPEWALKIEGLRDALKLSQAGLAKRLNVSPMAPSRWERGINEPAPDTYIQLGKLAGDPGCWYFWERAGLSRGDINEVLTGTGVAISTSGLPNSLQKGHAVAAKPKLAPAAKAGNPEFVLVPVIDFSGVSNSGLTALTGIRQLPQKQSLSAPRSWCPHPEETVYVEVRSGAMAPTLAPGDLVALDTFEVDAPEGSAQIAAYYPNEGILVGTLRVSGRISELVLQSRTEPILLQSARILGRVLWWIGRPR